MNATIVLSGVCLSLGLAGVTIPSPSFYTDETIIICDGCVASAWNVIGVPAGPGAGRVIHPPTKVDGECWCLEDDGVIIIGCSQEQIDDAPDWGLTCVAEQQITETIGGGTGGTLPNNTVGPPVSWPQSSTEWGNTGDTVLAKAVVDDCGETVFVEFWSGPAGGGPPWILQFTVWASCSECSEDCN